ncbi:MAG: hypothetical protein K1W31_17410 [Lachnospiraceae bacterium]
MIKLLNLSYEELAEKVRKEDINIFVYGAGMIGQIVVPDVLKRFQLERYLQFFVDADCNKQGRQIEINRFAYEIKSPEELRARCCLGKNSMILITNSHFEAVIGALDGFPELDGVEACMIPVIQIAESKKSVHFAPVRVSKQPMIPKVIHYCWFSGKEMPAGFKKCMESWEKLCPGYEIRRWDESNYDVGKNPYMKEAYERQKWGFVPDYARLDILYHHGGIYIDTDVELVRNLDELLYQPAFCGVEKWGNVNMGGCSGAVAGHPMIKKMLEARENISFIREDGSLNLETCGVYETQPLIREGMRVDNQVQTVNGMTVYSSDYFSPYDYMSGELAMTENTFSVHHFNGGWLDEKAREQRRKTQAQYQTVLRRMEKV